MRLSVLIKTLGSVTVLALVYINMQMQIIELAYRGKAKEVEIRHLVELNGAATYTILTLKSSNNLGINLLSENSDMEFIDPSNIMQISAPAGYLLENQLYEQTVQAKESKGLLSFLSLNR